MKIFSFHLLEVSPLVTLGTMLRPLNHRGITGLLHAECMAAMALGAPILSPKRLQMRNLAVFAVWESEGRLDAFLKENKLGCQLAEGWYVRLQLLRQWGEFCEFKGRTDSVSETDPLEPIVAITLARLRLAELARFIRWGRPVEVLVRDHPAATLALAAVRPFGTFSTFSVWRSLRDMTDMVQGRSSCEGGQRHSEAMLERKRRDFHYEFTTFRFRAISEHGRWLGRSDFVGGGP